MVRTVADRALAPTRDALEEIGDMMILTGKAIVSAIKPPYPDGGELISLPATHPEIDLIR